MRLALLLVCSCSLYAQQPFLYARSVVNAASYAPFGLPNAAVARGSIFTVFGENLGPAQSPALAFPLSATLGGVSLSVAQKGVATAVYPIYVSATQINAILPSTVAAGLASLRLTYQGVKSNAIPMMIADASPGIFAVSGGGFGPGIVQNYVTAANQPINTSIVPAAPGQVITIWGTGLGPVTFADNVAPTAGNVATPVTVTIGGQPAAVAYSGRTPCCAGVDQVVVTVPANAPTGCWVPVSINAGGTVSNTATMAIAGAPAATCDDAGSPLSKLVRTGGTQAFIHIERVNLVENLNPPDTVTKVMDELYSRFYTRPNSPYNFDPYLSFPPAGACLVHQTNGDAYLGKSLRGALPGSADISPQPNVTYNNGTQPLNLTGMLSASYGPVAGTVDGAPFGMNLLTGGGSYVVDPGGPNQASLNFTQEPAPKWTAPNGIVAIPRNTPLTLSFTPGDTAAPTAIMVYAYAAATNSTVEVECLAPPGAQSFTVPADALSNLPASYAIRDGSYVNLFIGTLGVNKAVTFTNGLAASGVLLNSNWVAQSVVLR
jgi:uncharacterized protein (TIGR03437 family)